MTASFHTFGLVGIRTFLVFFARVRWFGFTCFVFADLPIGAMFVFATAAFVFFGTFRRSCTPLRCIHTDIAIATILISIAHNRPTFLCITLLFHRTIGVCGTGAVVGVGIGVSIVVIVATGRDGQPNARQGCCVKKHVLTKARRYPR